MSNLANYLSFNLGGTGTPPTVALVPPSSDYSVELRVRFPEAGDTRIPLTQLSGALWTLSSGSLYASAWYQKSSLTSLTGDIYVTSSFGKVSLSSVPVFDDRFYNVSFVFDSASGGATLRTMLYDVAEVIYSTGSFIACSSSHTDFNRIEVGSSVTNPSRGEFWAQELRLWRDALTPSELEAHTLDYESYGREATANNSNLVVHLRLNDGVSSDASGSFPLISSLPWSVSGTAQGFFPFAPPFTKFLQEHSYIPSIEYGWNQKKIRIFDGPRVDPTQAYQDERFLSLEFNMYDALNEDISHILSSYDELSSVIGLPVNRYREDYEGLQRMRETYFKRLQGPLNSRVFIDMLDFFDSSFSSVIERLLPARAIFKGDEIVMESHMLERPKYQYQLRPITEGLIDITGVIPIIDYGDDYE